jgi:hypothetical protein
MWSAAALLPLSSTAQSLKSYRAPEPVFRAARRIFLFISLFLYFFTSLLPSAIF